MPHTIQEVHLEEICANCRLPHGNDIKIFASHGKIYEEILCQHCRYEIIKVHVEKTFSDRWEMIHKG